MEKPYSSKEIAPFDLDQDPVDLYFDLMQVDKPLPPTPRKPSSVYSMQIFDNQKLQKSRVGDNALPSPVLLAPTKYRSSTSKLPDPIPSRPRLTREVKTHAVSDSVVEKRRAREDSTSSSANIEALQNTRHNPNGATRRLETTPNQNHASRNSDANKHAEDYTAILHTQSSVLPNFIPEPYVTAGHYHQHGQPPPAMSPRITDVVDHSLFPPPLRFSMQGESERPLSRFSASSSEVEEALHGIRDSLRSMARKAFRMRKDSEDDTDDTDWAAFTKFQHMNSPTPRRQSRVGSFVSQRRASLQHGITEMYEILTNLTTPSKRARPTAIDTANSVQIHRPRIRSPAIPLSPYQEIGPKAWETSSKSSKKTTKSDKSKSVPASHKLAQEQKRVPAISSTLRRDSRKSGSNETKERSPRSMVSKLASAIQNGQVQVESAVGLSTSRVKRTKSEKKREELKKKIVVLGLGDQREDGEPPRWV
ncbi:MAG: hypothetical protein Q9190_004962 [Brigantiaea leucoxantha]